MAKKGLLAKMFGKQDSDCCSVSFEEVNEAAEGREAERGSEEQGAQRGGCCGGPAGRAAAEERTVGK